MILLTTDLHLTDRPRDEYRWELFPWLRKQCQKHVIELICVLGDLTDLKDNHSAKLTNRLVEEMRGLALCTSNLILLRGNHDCTNPENPFFEFLEDPVHNNIRYIRAPVQEEFELDNGEIEVLALPHSRQPTEDWKGISFGGADLVLMHQTLTGARASNGMPMQGLSSEMFKGVDVRLGIFSGDIHVPQKIGNVTYIGSPYPVHFGDRFEPRCILLDPKTGNRKDLHFPCLKKMTLEIKSPEQLEDYDLEKDDQVKIRLKLSRADLVEWQNYKKAVQTRCRELGVDLVGVELKAQQHHRLLEAEEKPKPVSHDNVLLRFCAREKLDKFTVEKGKEILDE